MPGTKRCKVYSRQAKAVRFCNQAWMQKNHTHIVTS